ncbi:RNA-binding transcriptional accessory protein [Apilactobacillus apisilvae]|uniref:RNA-binding transcriptional accessory protein n=1 Tax=Apilactobacillus apisilvae TaxID=2923364 RepID=A0ABY4PGV9_9LACO|nr:Tex family protein [Apilactobacillus apisilvae]UQS85025.1 RNA-binding transcriptional accessory protein [Apilactobacillus apisilvae]
MNVEIIKAVANNLKDYSIKQINAVITMLDAGNTVPFIARYRKEKTNSLDEVQIRLIEDENIRINHLFNRQDEVIKLIEEQNNLTKELSSKIRSANNLQQVEDLYLPYKKKRKTKADIAKEQGLEPLAQKVLSYDNSFEQHSADFINEDLNNKSDVLNGVHEILAEKFGNIAEYREWVRQYTFQTGSLNSKNKKNSKDEEQVYKNYYEFEVPIKKLKSYQVLAINRGENDKILTVKVVVNKDKILRYLFNQVNHNKRGKAVEFIENSIKDAYNRFIGPAINREIRNQITSTADEHAIKIFGKNLYKLLMQSPLKGKTVMGFDPAYRTGCKLAVVDNNGKFLDKLVIYPHKPASNHQREQALKLFLDFIKKNHVEMIAIGNGTASRESEQFVINAIKKIPWDLYYVIVNEAGASVYSASQNARDEFPEFNVEERSAVSIGRRLQDPLAELIKIDPKSVGVGQYQHDLPEKQLDQSLNRVVETAVNNVGVNVNTASVELLTHISGMNQNVAKKLVKYRNENGRFNNRVSLSKVPRLGKKTYEQSVGFLRIIDGDNKLDNTDIHPESYPIAEKIIKLTNIDINNLGSDFMLDKLNQININEFISANHFGKETVYDIFNGLKKPGRDFRENMPKPKLKQDILKIEDLSVNMKLQGTVRNVVDFGAFVDIGLKQDGLIHISNMSDSFISDPNTIVSIGDVVTVWVKDIDVNRNRIQLTMMDPEKN